MGEFADMAIADSLDMYWDGHDEGGGWLGPRYRPRRPKTCRSCSEYPLYWRDTDSGWRLHDCVGQLHVCNMKSRFEQMKKNPYLEYLDSIPPHTEADIRA